MTAHLRAWAQALGGDVSGSGVNCPGPGHSRHDRSLSVTPSATSADGFIVHSFASDDAIACKDYVRAKLGLPAFQPQDRRREPPTQKPEKQPKKKDSTYHNACWPAG